MTEATDPQPVSPDRQATLAVSNALVQIIDLLVSKGTLTKPEVVARLDAEAASFATMDRPAAASFTRLIADSFRGGDGQAD